MRSNDECSGKQATLRVALGPRATGGRPALRDELAELSGWWLVDHSRALRRHFDLPHPRVALAWLSLVAGVAATHGPIPQLSFSGTSVVVTLGHASEGVTPRHLSLARSLQELFRGFERAGQRPEVEASSPPSGLRLVPRGKLR